MKKVVLLMSLVFAVTAGANEQNEMMCTTPDDLTLAEAQQSLAGFIEGKPTWMGSSLKVVSHSSKLDALNIWKQITTLVWGDLSYGVLQMAGQGISRIKEAHFDGGIDTSNLTVESDFSGFNFFLPPSMNEESRGYGMRAIYTSYFQNPQIIRSLCDSICDSVASELAAHPDLYSEIIDFIKMSKAALVYNRNSSERDQSLDAYYDFTIIPENDKSVSNYDLDWKKWRVFSFALRRKLQNPTQVPALIQIADRILPTSSN